MFQPSVKHSSLRTMNPLVLVTNVTVEDVKTVLTETVAEKWATMQPLKVLATTILIHPFAKEVVAETVTCIMVVLI